MIKSLIILSFVTIILAKERLLCLDMNDSCEEWAETGECESNPNFMLRECSESCGVCAEELSEEEEFERGSDFGEIQGISYDDGGTMPGDIYWMIAKARSYMTYIVPDEFGEYMLDVCTNQHEDCAYWAFLGECENNAEYMKTNCAPVCGSCNSLTLEERCPPDPDMEDVWQSGDLNRLFERLTQEPLSSKYQVEILSSPAKTDGPWVITLENFISSEEAFRMIELGHIMKYSRSTDVGERNADGTYNNVVSTGRTSTNAWCDDICEEDPIAIAINDRLSKLIGIPETNSEHLQLLRYKEGQFYESHHDLIAHQVNKQGGGRIITAFIYLNDVEEGGGTHFEMLNLTVTPKLGRVVIWPSVRDENPSEKDQRTMHEALPVEKGIKYGANAWFHLRDFKTANDRGCM